MLGGVRFVPNGRPNFGFFVAVFIGAEARAGRIIGKG